MSMITRWSLRCLVVFGLLLNVAAASAAAGSYQDLLGLFQRWRTFEEPARVQGAPDYSAAAMQSRRAGLQRLQAELAAIDPKGWPVEQQVDYHLVRAEMNGLDFYLRVLMPWQRDPSFYASIRTSQSDTPAEEGPTIHGAVRLWKYSFWPRTSLSVLAPLSAADQQRLARELATIPPLLEQARTNLTGNARDLWVGGIKTHQEQGETLAEVAAKTKGSSRELRLAVEKARAANRDFVAWLQQQAPSKTGPSGIGKDDYTWHLRNVLLVPMTWDEEVTIMRRELARAHASLLLEEQRNRELPPLDPVNTAEDFAQLQDRAIGKYLDFMAKKDILPIKPYYEQALRERVFAFSPEATRNFFHQATHREPMTLWTHLYHYWDKAQAEQEPHASQIRRSPSLYNVWMSRSEGMATVMEEWMMHAGLYDDNPRAREIVLDHARQPCRPGAEFAVCLRQPGDDGGRQRDARQGHAARLDEPEPGAARLRATLIYAPARLRSELCHRGADARCGDDGAQGAARRQVHDAWLLRGGERCRRDSGIAPALAAHGAR